MGTSPRGSSAEARASEGTVSAAAGAVAPLAVRSSSGSVASAMGTSPCGSSAKAWASEGTVGAAARAAAPLTACSSTLSPRSPPGSAAAEAAASEAATSAAAAVSSAGPSAPWGRTSEAREARSARCCGVAGRRPSVLDDRSSEPASTVLRRRSDARLGEALGGRESRLRFNTTGGDSHGRTWWLFRLLSDGRAGGGARGGCTAGEAAPACPVLQASEGRRSR
mmetsp:Transcript_70678/g.182228  ORF Transcript_70678/g.182228 Transcript_70678/m.182228 type:complete len:223 (+) Transcript_70678:906-1574(+)